MITERIDKFSLKQLLLVVSGFGSYFVDRKAIHNSSEQLQDILLAISPQIERVIKSPSLARPSIPDRPLTFYQVTSILWSYQYFFLDHSEKFGHFESVMRDYLENMICTSLDQTSKFNMALDLH